MEREFLFRNNLKEDAHRVTSLLENNIQNKAVSNEGLSASIKNSNSLTTTKMILSTHPTTETSLPIPEYNTRFTTAKTKTASSSITTTTRSTHFLSQKTPKVSFFYLEDIYTPTRNYFLASKYAKTTTPHYLSGKFHFKDYIDMTEFWSDKYDERKTFKNDFDDFYENY